MKDILSFPLRAALKCVSVVPYNTSSSRRSFTGMSATFMKYVLYFTKGQTSPVTNRVHPICSNRCNTDKCFGKTFVHWRNDSGRRKPSGMKGFKWKASAAPSAGLKSLYTLLDDFDLDPLDL